MYQKLTASFLTMFFIIATGTVCAQQMQRPEGNMEMVKSPEMDKIRHDLKKTKRKLASEGHYACCNKPSCDFCGISMNSCQCGDNVRSDKGGVCGECMGGWKTGHGAIPGKTADQIKMVSPVEAKMGYDMREEMFDMTDMKKQDMKKMQMDKMEMKK